MKKTYLALALAAIMASNSAYAQTTQTGNDNQSNTMGDTSSVVNNGNTSSSAAQLGNSSNSIASGTTISPETNSQITGTISGGNTNSNSSSLGNKLDNKNTSSVGNTSSNSGGNILGQSQGLSNSGNSASNSGGNKLGQSQGFDNSGNSTNDLANTNTNGQGQGQQQGIDSSIGNTNNNANGQGQGQQQGIDSSIGNANDVANSNDNSNRGTNEQGQGQDQGQGQSQGLDNTNRLGQSNDNSGNSANDVAQGQDTETSVNVDAADRSSYQHETNVDARSWYIPSVVPPTPASVTGVGNIIHDVSTCGPLQSVIREPVQGHYFGMVSTTQFDLSYNDTLIPFFDDNGYEQLYRNVQGRYYGHQVISDTAILGTAAARNAALGGGGNDANWGQGGMGSSSSVQAMVTHIQLRLCDAGGREPQALPIIPGDIRQ